MVDCLRDSLIIWSKDIYKLKYKFFQKFNMLTKESWNKIKTKSFNRVTLLQKKFQQPTVTKTKKTNKNL